MDFSMTPNTDVEKTMFAIARSEAVLHRKRHPLQIAREAGGDTASLQERLAALEQAQTERMTELAIVLAGDREHYLG